MKLTETYRKRLQELAGIDEAFIMSWVPDSILTKLGIDPKSAQKLGEGDNGIAYRVGDKTIKVTYDSAEADFAETIKGHKLSRVANVYDVYEYDTERGEDNRNQDQFSSSRYYWVIIKEFIPYNFGSDGEYYDALSYFNTYQLHNFDYSEKDFRRMIDEYRKEHLECMADEEGYDIDEDYELENTIRWFEVFEELHFELKPLGILSASDMKSSNMGVREDGEPVYLELHIYKTTSGYKEPQYKQLK